MHRIESRLLPAPVDDARLARLVELTRRIADAIGRGDHGLAPLLEEWNASAHRRYAEVDFTALHGAMDAEAFASEALSRPAGYLADLRFEEASAAMGAVAGAKLSEAQTATALRGLENNFPGAEVSDLIFWPGQWFGDASLLHVELSPDQLAGYACARSGRVLTGAPEDLRLPYPVPRMRAVIPL